MPPLGSLNTSYLSCLECFLFGFGMVYLVFAMVYFVFAIV